MTTTSTGPRTEELLGTARRSAVHLEMRDAYMTSDPRFQAWKQGEHEDSEQVAQWSRPWLDLVSGLVARGVQMRRARIVSEPVSEYIAFEYAITGQNIKAGEEVRWLPRRRASDLALPGNDFWLVDGDTVLWNHFTGDGEVSPVGRELCEDPAAVVLCAAAFEAVWDRAIPHQEYRTT